MFGPQLQNCLVEEQEVRLILLRFFYNLQNPCQINDFQSNWATTQTLFTTSVFRRRGLVVLYLALALSSDGRVRAGDMAQRGKKYMEISRRQVQNVSSINVIGAAR